MLLQLLIALAAVVITGQLLSRLLARIGQPPVIGEVLAGILLGPSLLGTEWSARILPATVAPGLGAVAQLGVILYMFLVGLELQLGRLARRAGTTVVTSYASIILPFALGAWLAVYLYPAVSDPSVPFASFALFLGVAMSITAFPVLARILRDRGMAHTELGTIALSCAAIGDVTAWCLLAFVVGIAQSDVGSGLQVTVAACAYIAAMFFVARPRLARYLRAASDDDDRRVASLLFALLLLSAIVTEAIGVHAIFGAFLLGAIVPSDSRVARTMTSQLEPVVTVLLLPAFFAFTGMRTRIDLVSGWESWGWCLLILVVATAGKFGGTALASRATGLRWREAATLGALMNTRGLMELIVLNIGLELGIISPALFAMLVIMALATTMMTAPAISWLGGTAGLANGRAAVRV